MKRSQVNAILHAATAYLSACGMYLPPFAHFTPQQLRQQARSPIVQHKLGYDITDFGLGNFFDTGLFLFTTRNGSLRDLERGQGMVYAEKIMIVRDRQTTPRHRHKRKTEDIINRNGGTLVIELHASDPQGLVDPQGSVHVALDGIERTFDGGSRVSLAPGASITLPVGVWHSFWAERGDCLVGEVSAVNDDETDNVFDPPVGRFARIEEDEEPWRLLVSDYERWPGA